jgi:hypothetical protein
MSLEKNDIIFTPESTVLKENEFIFTPADNEMVLALNIMMYNGALRLYEHLQEIPGVSKKTLQTVNKYIEETYG